MVVTDTQVLISEAPSEEYLADVGIVVPELTRAQNRFGSLVSIVLSARNEERHLAEALNSMVNQTHANWECLIADDGSTDATRSIVERFAATDERFRVWSFGESAGLAPRLNHLVKESAGILIARMDADDRMLPHRLEEQVRFFDNLPESEFDNTVLGGSVLLMDREGAQIGERIAPTSERINARHFPPVLHPTVMASRAFFTANPYSESERFRRAEDSELWVRVAKTTTFRNIENPVLEYRTIGSFEPARFVRSQHAMVRIGLDYHRASLLVRGSLGVVAGVVALRNSWMLSLAMKARRSLTGERLGHVLRVGMNAAVQRLGRVAVFVALLISFDLLSIGHRTFRAPYPFQLQGPIIFIVVGAICSLLSGLPEGAQGKREALVMATASAVATMFGCLVLMAVMPPFLPRFLVLVSPAVTAPMLYIAWLFSHHSGRRDQKRTRVFAIVTSSEAKLLRDDLASYPERSASLAGVLCIDESNDHVAQGAFLLHRAVEVEATILVVSVQAQNSAAIMESIMALHARGMRVRSFVSFYEQWLGKLPIFEISAMALMADTSDGHRIGYGRARRVFDIAIGFVGLVVAVAFTPFLLVVNSLFAPGPLMFSQLRVGRNGRTFRVHKFRTMRPDPVDTDGYGDWSDKDDPRITTVGRALRRLHIDEFPQFWNILKGDLSLVGPRPEQPRYVEQLTKDIPHYGLRHNIRPGLTGWAQVKWPYGSSDNDSLHKLQYDLFYLVHQNLYLDLRILIRTIRMTFIRGGR